MSEGKEDRTALSWWFPRIEAAGLPVPRTRIVHMAPDAQKTMYARFDGGSGDEGQERALKAFHDELAAAGDEVGWPCFLRTDQTSGKHNWSRTCYVEAATQISAHVDELILFSEMAGLIGRPWHTWAVREFLPTMPLGRCPRYGDMPVCREFRFFVDAGEVGCWHPYWPDHALERGGAKLDEEARRRMVNMTAPEHSELTALAERAGKAVGGAWSVDLLETRRGWFVTDMAEAHKSWHDWPGCPNDVGVRHRPGSRT